MIKINKWLQQNWFKKRFIFDYNPHCKIERNLYHVEILKGESINKYRNFFLLTINNKILDKRIKNPNITCFLVLEKQNKVPVGYEWIYYSSNTKNKHDNFQVLEKEGLLFNAYINKNERGKGIFQFLKNSAACYLKNKLNSKNVLSVVEQLNKASIDSNKKIGAEIIGTNYLLKIYKRNVISLTIRRNMLPKINFISIFKN